MQKKVWYCQRDGGQWNVPCILHDVYINNGVHLSTIHGPKLMSSCNANGEGWLIVESEGQVFDEAQ